ncbi:MAG TPA: GDSL-type esterase/lipase family protein [Kiritimatiellia bacterium]|nr:GDSL-type esterase/lipase family protein [Kiritimatiellia bacterium]
MKFISRFPGILRICLIGGTAFALSACEQTGDGGLGSGHNFGDNDPNIVYCLGDSITQGAQTPGVAPYPAVLSGMIGKTCINGGIGGTTSASGVSRVNGVISSVKPGYMIIFYGHNDIYAGYSHEQTRENIRYMINACRAAQVIPIVCNLNPVYFGHGVFAGEVRARSDSISSVANEEGVKLANIMSAFGNDESLLSADGLHPSQEGQNVIASTLANIF